MSKIYAFDIWVASHPEFRQTTNAVSAGKAKSHYLASLQEAWPDFKYLDLRAVKVGPPRSSEQFLRNAKYRGVPDARCGQAVTIGAAHGVIVGHNSSANFDVLFDDDSPKYAGETLNVHPDSVVFDDVGQQLYTAPTP